MSELAAALALKSDLAAVRRKARERGWRVEMHDGIRVAVSLASAIDGQRYILGIIGTGYPDAAPSIKPIILATWASADRTAWPDCEGFRPVSDICMPLSAEGFALHPAWQQDPALRWSADGNPLLRVLEELQGQLDNRAKYRGRTR